MSLLRESITGLVPLDLTVEVLAPVMSANANFPSETSPSWVNPIVTATVRGRLAPASTKALERVGRIGRVGVHELYTERTTTIGPLGRVRVGAQQFSVVDSRSYRERVHAIIEEVNP